MLLKSFIYSLKVWLTTVVITPFVFLLPGAFGQSVSNESIYEQISRSVYVYGEILVVELIISFITWVVFLIIIQITVTYCATRIARLSIISISGVLLTIGTFWVILSPTEIFSVTSDMGGLVLCTCFCIAAGSWFYKLKIEDDIVITDVQ